MNKAYGSGPQPVLGLTDDKASALKNEILGAGDVIPKTVTGNIWYISENGDDSNAGNDRSKPWRTIEKYKQNIEKIGLGDAVLFERGGTYRGFFETVSGVYYGAYGEGYKPVLTSSMMNYAKARWTEKEENLWVCDEKMPLFNGEPCDVGIIVGDEGEFIGFKKPALEEVIENGDFFCKDGDVYLKFEKNPSEAFGSIEIGPRLTVLGLYGAQHDVTVDNLCVRYSGAHGIASVSGVKNITVRNCEFGFIGGTYLYGTLRFGNAIEFFGACENILVENNWIYQIYDSGITHQGGDNYVARNLTFRKNLIEYCGMGSIEYWLAYERGKAYNYAENVTYADNIMRYSGYCWGGVQRPDKVSSHILSNGANQNHFVNYKITGNIFDQSTHDLLEITSLDETYPELSDNVYVQKDGLRLGSFGHTRDVIFDGDVQKRLTEEWGDKSAKIVVAK